MRAKAAATANMSADEARRIAVDWAKAAATSDEAANRHAREDGTTAPSNRSWAKMVKDGRVSMVPPTTVDVRAVREKIGLSQAEFAGRFGFTVAAVRQWEQGRRLPQGPARILLTVIAREPRAVERALTLAAE